MKRRFLAWLLVIAMLVLSMPAYADSQYGKVGVSFDTSKLTFYTSGKLDLSVNLVLDDFNPADPWDSSLRLSFLSRDGESLDNKSIEASPYDWGTSSYLNKVTFDTGISGQDYLKDGGVFNIRVEFITKGEVLGYADTAITIKDAKVEHIEPDDTSDIPGVSYFLTDDGVPDWLDFGVVSNKYTNDGDAETNFATGEFYWKKSNGGDNPTDPDGGDAPGDGESNLPGDIWIGKVADQQSMEALQGDFLHDGRTRVYIDEKYVEIIRKKIEKIAEQSAAIGKLNNVELPDVGAGSDFNTSPYKIDVRGDEFPSTLYINIDSILASVQLLELYMRPDQVVVFNITGTSCDAPADGSNWDGAGAVTLPQFNLYVGGEAGKGSEGAIKFNEHDHCADPELQAQMAQQVIINIPNAKAVYNRHGGQLDASIIAPNAFVKNETTTEGWIVCDHMWIAGGEWHHISQNVKRTADSDLTIRKQVGEGVETQDFEFEVTIHGVALSGSKWRDYFGNKDITNIKLVNHEEKKHVDTVFTVTVKAGESFTIKGLPAGCSYDVKELTTEEGVEQTWKNQSGDINGQDVMVTCKNYKDDEDKEIPEEGSLKIRKRVLYNGKGGKEFSFDFKVTLTPPAGEDWGTSKTFGSYTFTKDGEENTYSTTITLEGSGYTGSVIIEGLPKGTTYTVTELPSGEYTLQGDNDLTGEITGDESVQFVNGNNNTSMPGDLVVVKTVKGTVTEDAVFTFKVTLKGLQDNGQGYYSFSGVRFEKVGNDYVGYVTIKGNGSKTIKGLPAGTTYEVVEEKTEGYTQESADGNTGAIKPETESTAKFVNKNDDGSTEPETGDLEVTKKVTGTAGDTEKEFNFTVTLSDTSINGTYGDMTFEDGVATFTLKHGESKTATGLPADVTYTVTETEANADGYTTTETDSGNGELVVDDKVVVEFENHKDITVVEPAPVKQTVTFDKIVNVKSGDPDEDTTFDFVLEFTGTKEDGIAKPNPTKLETSIEYVKGEINYTGTFDEIEFTEAGTYYFTLSETQYDDDNWTADVESWEITIVVTEEDGELVASTPHGYNETVGDREPARFVNTYEEEEEEEPTPTPTTTPTNTPTNTTPTGNNPTPTPGTVVTPTPTAQITEEPTPTPAPTPVPVTNVEGQKTWQDNDNAGNTRPASITVRLMRDGVQIAQTTVTASNGWKYSFTNLPMVDENGRPYSYSVTEQMVAGYYAVVSGYNITNVLIPNTPNNPNVPDGPDSQDRTPDGGRIQRTRTPDGNLVNIVTYSTPLGFGGAGEPTVEELEDLIELFGYGTPLWGGLLQTGDQLPIYPFVFGGFGLLALALLAILEQKRRKQS